MALAIEASQNPGMASVEPQNVAGVSNDDAILNQAIMASMNQENNGINQVTQEPLNPEQRKREENVPCGLKNVGNTCYVNSILQVYYNIPSFTQAILTHLDDDIQLQPLLKANKGQDENPQSNTMDSEVEQMIQRLEASRTLIRQLKVLFGQMTKSDKKYGDPTPVLNAITDNYGKPVEIGNEQDIGEFNGIFLARVQEGLNFRKIYDEAKERLMQQEQEELKQAAENQEADDLKMQKLDSSIIVEQTDSKQVEEKKYQDVKDTDMKNEEKDVIDENFKGKIRSIITYTGSDGQQKTKESLTDMFATILIRVIGFKEIYEAWEEQYKSALEDYNPNDQYI